MNNTSVFPLLFELTVKTSKTFPKNIISLIEVRNIISF